MQHSTYDRDVSILEDISGDDRREAPIARSLRPSNSNFQLRTKKTRSQVTNAFVMLLSQLPKSRARTRSKGVNGESRSRIRAKSRAPEQVACFPTPHYLYKSWS